MIVPITKLQYALVLASVTPDSVQNLGPRDMFARDFGDKIVYVDRGKVLFTFF